MGKKWTGFLAAVLLLAGLAVLSYPVVSNYVNQQNSSYAIQQLLERTEGSEAMSEQLALAREYNRDLATGAPEGYDRILDFGGGLMGYLEIPKIGLRLPIYHGVSDEVLNRGVGHLPDTAFPIGGPGNHTVLTGHTGLPSARLFTDLTELKPGDLFHITAAGRTVTYAVDQILVVLPQETAALGRIDGMDCCTLVTCTPYGVNSHRLLVRGIRKEDIP